jgi:superfamily II RNA helicase
MVTLIKPEWEKLLEKKIWGFELSPFQRDSCVALLEGYNCLTMAGTGSGKTVVARFLMKMMVEKEKKKVIYCSPIKALTNDLYDKFKNKYSHITFGISTGDIKENLEADVIFCTTETLENNLFLQTDEKKALDFNLDFEKDVGAVIYDEIQYIFSDRANAWNNSILQLPKHIQILGLSATLAKPEKFIKWLSYVRDREAKLCCYKKRMVPLYHYGWLTVNNNGKIKNLSKQEQKFIQEMKDRKIDIKVGEKFEAENVQKMMDYKKLLGKNKIYVNEIYSLTKLFEHVKNNNELPMLVFVYSRLKTQVLANRITISLLEEGSKVPHIVSKFCEKKLKEKLTNWKEYTEIPEYNNLIKLFQKGIAYHHSGMIPIFKELVEIVFKEGMIKLLFSTESMAVGLNLPFKSVGFVALNKYTKNGNQYLTTDQYLQQAGRAGRRGLDDKGCVYHVYNNFKDNRKNPLDVPTYYKIVNGKLVEPSSKIQINFNMLLKLIQKGVDVEEFIKKSYINMTDSDIESQVKENTDLLKCENLVDKLEINCENREYLTKLTDKGKLALCMQEIPSVAFADFMMKQRDILKKCTSKEFATVLSVFANIRLREEDSVNSPINLKISDNTKYILNKLSKTLKFWEDKEIRLMNKVEGYKIQYNICEIVRMWCDVKEGEQFRIFEELRYWGIFLGDFVKAIKKIVSITNELEKYGNLIEDLSLIEKMKDIRSMLMKSIATNQSLYL